MAITQAEIIGIREAEQTDGATTWNYTSYSLLVFYDNQAPQLVEGKGYEVEKYLQYVKPKDDTNAVKALFETHEAVLREMIQAEVLKAFVALHPLPAIEGLQEGKAIQVLKDAGFAVELLNQYPDGTPQGIVYQVSRKEGAYMTALLDVRLKLPDVIGMSRDEAMGVLFEKGFSADVIEMPSNEVPGGYVCACQRESDTSIKVKLLVSMAIPDVTGMTVEEATKALETAGALVTISKTTDDRVPVNHVISWSNGIPPMIDLLISTGKDKYDCPHLAIRAGRIDDCRSSQFAGSATIDRKKGLINISINYRLDMEHKHEWVESGSASMDNNQNTRISFSRVPKFESGQTQEIMLELSSYSFDQKGELPREAMIVLNTQYGTLRKTKVVIPLTIGFDWQ